MDIGKAFTYITEDEDWMKKLGIGALLGMIPIINMAVFGYQIQIARNVRQGDKRPLPTWDEFGSLLVDGLRFLAVILIYMLPVMIVYFAVFGVAIFSMFTMESAAYNAGSYAYDDAAFSAMPLAAMMISMMCIMPYSLLIWLLYPLFFIQIARRESLKACFDFREMWALFRAQPVNYFIIVAIMFGLYMGLSIVMMPIYLVAAFIPCFGFLVTMFLAGLIIVLFSVVSGHLEGQFMIEGDNTNKFDEFQITTE